MVVEHADCAFVDIPEEGTIYDYATAEKCINSLETQKANAVGKYML